VSILLFRVNSPIVPDGFTSLILFFLAKAESLEYSIEYVLTRGFDKKVPRLIGVVTSFKPVDESAIHLLF
jgi:hypothetical protein